MDKRIPRYMGIASLVILGTVLVLGLVRNAVVQQWVSILFLLSVPFLVATLVVWIVYLVMRKK